MKPIWEAYLCQIDITNVCPEACLYCDRYVRHIRKDQHFFMPIKEVEKALDSLEGWPGKIGIIGGEPTIHPQFVEICELIRDRGLRNKSQLFTIGGKKYEKNLQVIEEAFFHISCNPHTPEQKNVCLVQPITVAIQDVVENAEYRAKLIDECWVQRTWCPTIGPKGAFFCEIAYALDVILDGPGGYPIKPDWWRKTPREFKDQIDRYCKYCGMPVPMERELLKEKREKITPGLYNLFKQHNLPRLSTDDVTIFDRKFTIKEMEETKKTWDPGNYRQDIRKDMKEGWKRRSDIKKRVT
jgi:hypothetical protein